ncbi:MAG TPA: hypothetical protein VFB60_21330 [Ktedonobacteraceae bacterium]|nr:hypothetical protein [Ktedonobacteraceae bacterium]
MEEIRAGASPAPTSHKETQPGEQHPTIAKRRKRRWVAALARVLLLLLFIGGFVLSMLPWGRAVARSTQILPALITASEPASLIATGEPIGHTQMTVPSKSGPVYLDIYAPTSPTPLLPGTRGGALIIPGAGDNRQVPQLINLSESLARSGLVVMNMTTQIMMNYTISVEDTDAVVQAFKALTHLPGMTQNRAGIIAFSAGVPLACFGAADPRIRDEVAYVAVFGGYFDTESVLRAFGRRAVTADGKTEPWYPAEVPIQVLTNVITQTFSPQDRTLITNALPNGTPLTQGEFAQLSPQAQAAYQLLTGNAPDKVDQNIAALSPAVHVQLDELSPSKIIDRIRAPFFLLHDRNDTSVPFTESRAFAAALARLHHPYEYVEFHIFDHVEVRSNLALNQELTDGSRLFDILTRLLLADS